jgi:hypothetical protein
VPSKFLDDARQTFSLRSRPGIAAAQNTVTAETFAAWLKAHPGGHRGAALDSPRPGYLIVVEVVDGRIV